MKYHLFRYLQFIGLTLMLLGCADDILYTESPNNEFAQINLYAQIVQEYNSRANDDGFADGDCMGIYIVDFDDDKPGTLDNYSNRATNLQFTYNSSDYSWTSSSKVYWKDDKTNIDIYGYYPFESSINSVSQHVFAVQTDQSTEKDDQNLGGYEKSDFLWAKKSAVSPTNEVIKLEYNHKMAGVKIALLKGEGFNENEWETVARTVTIDNTICQANIDLRSGEVSIPISSSESRHQIVTAPQGNDIYRGVIIPQTIDAQETFISISIDNVSYGYHHEAPLKFESGKMHSFILNLNKRNEGDYTISLVSHSIEPWENDNSTHDFESSAYTTIVCEKEGTLQQCFAQSGKSLTDILNLKIIGRMNDNDFEFLRQLTHLQRLNLFDVKAFTSCEDINNEFYEPGEECSEPSYYTEIMNSIKNGEYYENMLPRGALSAFSYKHLILPKGLIVLGGYALCNNKLAKNSTLVLPNSLKIICECALMGATGGTLELPDSLVMIENAAFYQMEFNFNLKLGNTIKYIGPRAFRGTNGASGTFRLPEHLEYIGSEAFISINENLIGSINIPQNLKVIPASAFKHVGFISGTTLTMHDGIYKIGDNAFGSQYYKRKFNYIFYNKIIWPKNLRFIGKEAFTYVKFSGGMSDLPETILSIGARAFQGCRNLPKRFVIPSLVESIEDYTFAYSDIESVELPKNCTKVGAGVFYDCENLSMISIGPYVEEIGSETFYNCKGLQAIKCLAVAPPVLGDNVFEQCDLEHLILEVPESSVNLYRSAIGWKDIKYITVYHELATSVSEIKCLDKGQTRNMIVRSEGPWEISECPSWVSINPTSSECNTTETKVTVNASSSERHGRLVLKLKNSDYTTFVDINQYIASVPEDKEVVLQKATSSGKPIPIFVIGDGFTADEVADGSYLQSMKENIEYLFSIEPFKTYRNYFSVSTALTASPESGINSVYNDVSNRFDTTDDPNIGLNCNFKGLKDYVLSISDIISTDNIANSMIMVIANQDNFNGNIKIEDSGLTFAIVLNCRDGIYPYDQRGLVQHFAGGQGFGRFGVEYATHYDFLKACTCTDCNKILEYNIGAAKGWYQNISLMDSHQFVPWSHLIFDSRYSNYVDIYEGAWWHTRGVWKSEPQSCMDTYIPYYSAWCRELIVRRIMDTAGISFDFEDFASRDSWEGRPEY